MDRRTARLIFQYVLFLFLPFSWFFICSHNGLVFLIVLLPPEIGPSIKKSGLRVGLDKMEEFLQTPFVTVAFFYIIAVPTGTNSASYLGSVSTGWRGLIKNTLQEQPCGPRTGAASPFQALRSALSSFYHFIISSPVLTRSISCLSRSQSLEVISVP